MHLLQLLIADDEPAIRWWLKQAFDCVAEQIDDVGDGEALLAALLRRRELDLVISDVRMPPHDGIELARRARRAGVTTPLLFLTAAPIDERMRRAVRELGRAALTAKPLSIDAVLEHARRLLASAEAAVRNAPEVV